MSRTRTSSRSRAAEEAAQWFATLQAPNVSVAEREAFGRWLAESVIHVKEYLVIAKLWHAVGQVAHKNVDELVAAARASIGTDRVTVLSAAREKSGRHDVSGLWSNSIVRRTTLAVGLAASVIAFAVLLIFDRGSGQAVQAYSTKVGEQLTISLEDGSTVRLNALSTLRVKLTPAHRDVELLSGEAFFQVAKDPTRPFIVLTGLAQVEAVGTVFNVYRKTDSTTVTVLEGVVGLDAVSQRAESTPETGSGAMPAQRSRSLLTSQQQATVSNGGRLLGIRTVRAADVTAWTERRLVLSGEKLRDVVAEFNRYNAAQLEIHDSALAELRISGVFAINDPASLVAYLQHSEKVTVSAADATSKVLILSRQN